MRSDCESILTVSFAQSKENDSFCSVVVAVVDVLAAKFVAVFVFGC